MRRGDSPVCFFCILFSEPRVRFFHTVFLFCSVGLVALLTCSTRTPPTVVKFLSLFSSKCGWVYATLFSQPIGRGGEGGDGGEGGADDLKPEEEEDLPVNALCEPYCGGVERISHRKFYTRHASRLRLALAPIVWRSRAGNKTI